MIENRNDLKEYIKEDNCWYVENGIKSKLIAFICDYPAREIKKYLKYLRKQEYYINTAHGSKVKGILGLIYEGKKNRLGNKLGIDIGPNCFGKGLQLYHAGSIIINSNVKAGDYCKLHGNNCIGNNGQSDETPVLGNHVDIGYGAVIIGNIELSNNIIIGANTVVNKSFKEDKITIAGAPARIISRGKDYV